jgi:hypothetical protein
MNYKAIIIKIKENVTIDMNKWKIEDRSRMKMKRSKREKTDLPIIRE